MVLPFSAANAARSSAVSSQTAPSSAPSQATRTSTSPSGLSRTGATLTNGGEPIPVRICEIAGLRKDGTLHFTQVKVPAYPIFEEAFSAFARGTLLQMPEGDIAIEDVQPGDYLNTSTGQPAKVMWVGASSFVPADAGRRTPLVRIMSDTFGLGSPSGFLTLGPGARILRTPTHLRTGIKPVEYLTPAREFLDGTNVIEIVPPTPVRLFHLVLERHAAIKADGMECETFHPGNTALRQMSHAMRDLFLSMFPHIGHVTDFGPLAHPRAPDIEAAEMA